MSTAVVPTPSVQGLHDFLHAPPVLQQIADALPRHLTPKRLIRQALTLCSDNPNLLKCTQRSLLAGVMRAAELGLELNGVLGQAYLVPYRNSRKNCHEANFQVGYRGLVDLAFRSGKVIAFPLRTVYANEPFEIHYGTRNELLHKPLPAKDRGEAVGYYASIGFAQGGYDFEFMHKDEVVAHMHQFARGYDKADSPWQTSFDEMAQKTCARKLCKRVPLSPQSQMAALYDEYAEKGVPLDPALLHLGGDNADKSRSQQLEELLSHEAQPGEGAPLVEGEIPADFEEPSQ